MPPTRHPRSIAGRSTETLSPQALVGAVLNQTYAVEALLNVGGMGAVYRARHQRTGRQYALKTLLPGAALSAQAIRRFKREATAASSLGHAGIVAVHDFDETADGVHYLVMDLLSGETLERRIEHQGSLRWEEARTIAAQLASALSAAHRAGLLHRDLKPANVILANVPGASERAVLVDFGLAKPIEGTEASRLTASGAAVGTPMYMAPEQARGAPVDTRTDVYGLAATIYETVTGAPPFSDATVAAVYAKLLTEEAPLAATVAARELPAELSAVLRRALAKDPNHRYPSVDAFAEALARC